MLIPAVGKAGEAGPDIIACPWLSGMDTGQSSPLRQIGLQLTYNLHGKEFKDHAPMQQEGLMEEDTAMEDQAEDPTHSLSPYSFFPEDQPSDTEAGPPYIAPTKVVP